MTGEQTSRDFSNILNSVLNRRRDKTNPSKRLRRVVSPILYGVRSVALSVPYLKSKNGIMALLYSIVYKRHCVEKFIWKELTETECL